MSAPSPLPEDVRRDLERMAGPLAERMLPPKVTTSATTRNVVAAVNDDGTVDVMMGGAVMQHVPATTACAGVAVGDEVIVEQYGPRLYCVGAMAPGNRIGFLKELGIFFGSMVVNGTGGTSAPVWTQDQFKALTGRNFNHRTDFVGFMNADGRAQSAHFSATYLNDRIYVTFDRVVSGTLRANYLIVLGAPA